MMAQRHAVGASAFVQCCGTVTIHGMTEPTSVVSNAWAIVPSSLAQWLGAVGTIAAVVLALFKDSILARWRRPRLVATCSKTTPWTGKVPFTVSSNGAVLWSGHAYWVRVRVENMGRSRARKEYRYMRRDSLSSPLTVRLRTLRPSFL
jgi:hypothetical protein